MAKPDSEVTGYAIEWKVEPSLWAGGKNRDLSLGVEGIRFSTDGQIIKAEAESSSFSQKEFQRIALDTINRLIQCHILSTGRPYKLGTPKIKVKKNGRITHILSPAGGVNVACNDSYISIDSEGNIITDSERETFNRSLTIFAWSTDPTLRGVLGYYSLALEGVDQLATAGNLYMAMEELKEAKEFTSWSDAYEKLERFSPNFSKTEYEALQEVLQNGRHAYYRLRKGEFKDKVIKSFPLKRCQLSASKKVVGELILAYVEWLKKRS